MQKIKVKVAILNFVVTKLVSIIVFIMEELSVVKDKLQIMKNEADKGKMKMCNIVYIVGYK